MGTTARVILTLDCNRRCGHCCNKFGKVMANAEVITDLADLKRFPVVCLTGGEPMLYPELVLDVAEKLRRINPQVKLYLYTARYVERHMPQILDVFDAINFTLHEPASSADAINFHFLQGMIEKRSREGERKSHRLCVDPNLEREIFINPRLWSRIDMRKWLTEDEMVEKNLFGPFGRESLFIYRPFRGVFIYRPFKGGGENANS